MSVANFIPTIWSARLLQHLDNALVARNFFNVDYEGEIRDKGDTVKINQIGGISIFDYQRNTDMNPPEELSMVAQSLIIDQGKAFNFQIDDVDAVQANATLMDAAMERSAFALAEQEDTFLFEKLAAGVAAENTLPDVTILSPEDAFTILVQLRTIMQKSNVPAQGRNLAAPPEFIAQLLNDTRFTGTGGVFAEGTLIAGSVGRSMGFNIFEVNNTPGNNTIIAGHNLGATRATRYLKQKRTEWKKDLRTA